MPMGISSISSAKSCSARSLPGLLCSIVADRHNRCLEEDRQGTRPSCVTNADMRRTAALSRLRQSLASKGMAPDCGNSKRPSRFSRCRFPPAGRIGDGASIRQPCMKGDAVREWAPAPPIAAKGRRLRSPRAMARAGVPGLRTGGVAFGVPPGCPDGLPLPQIGDKHQAGAAVAGGK